MIIIMIIILYCRTRTHTYKSKSTCKSYKTHGEKVCTVSRSLVNTTIPQINSS